MTWHTVAWKNVAPVAWRNGGGLTRELVAWPQAQDWVWRVSVADVEQNGPFSSYPGVERWFAVLSGAGVKLTIQETLQHWELGATSPPVRFDGAHAVACELVHGATQDFNVMVQKNAASATLQRLTGSFQTTLASDTVVGICSHGFDAVVRSATLGKSAQLELLPHHFAWQKLTAGSDIAIECKDVLYLEIALCP